MKILLNFSNHPSTQWKEEQLEAARCFDVVEDLAFPAVSPSMDEEELDELVEKYAEMIANGFDSSCTCVHIMGEMTFVFRMVFRLKTLGFRCIASTTERIAQVTPDGQKISSFQFVRFREY